MKAGPFGCDTETCRDHRDVCLIWPPACPVEQLAELVVVEKKIKTLTKELRAMVLARG